MDKLSTKMIKLKVDWLNQCPTKNIAGLIIGTPDVVELR